MSDTPDTRTGMESALDLAINSLHVGVEEIKRLERELAAKEGECDALKIAAGITIEQCLNCGGDKGHHEGCTGTSVTQLVVATNYDLKTQHAALRDEVEAMRKILTDIFPFVMEDYYEDCATPAFKSAMTALINEVQKEKP